MSVIKDIYMLVVLVDVRYFDHYLKMLISLSLYAMYKEVLRELDPMQFKVLILMNTHKDEDSEIYFDLSYIN